jgi:hypothetical protein
MPLAGAAVRRVAAGRLAALQQGAAPLRDQFVLAAGELPQQ